jgi:hypothetical protein
MGAIMNKSAKDQNMSVSKPYTELQKAHPTNHWTEEAFKNYEVHKRLYEGEKDGNEYKNFSTMFHFYKYVRYIFPPELFLYILQFGGDIPTKMCSPTQLQPLLEWLHYPKCVSFSFLFLFFFLFLFYPFSRIFLPPGRS